MKITTGKKILLAVSLLGFLVVAAGAVPHSFAATKKANNAVSVVGKAKFVIQGTVESVGANSLVVKVRNTSRNAKQYDNTDFTVNIGDKTNLTKNGKKIAIGAIKTSDKVRVFGVFDKKTGSIVLVRWVKVVGSKP